MTTKYPSLSLLTNNQKKELTALLADHDARTTAIAKELNLPIPSRKAWFAVSVLVDVPGDAIIQEDPYGYCELDALVETRITRVIRSSLAGTGLSVEECEFERLEDE